MAARYVNPDNVTAQGQYFYTGLLPGSYDTAGAGGGNVYGAGSGGSAGVSADRTGSDSKKTWDYQSKWEKPAGKSDKDEILDAIAGLGDPEASAQPDGDEDPPRGRRKGGGHDPGVQTPPDDDDSPVGPWGLTAGQKSEGGGSPPDDDFDFPDTGWSPMPHHVDTGLGTKNKVKRIRPPEEVAKRAAGVVTNRENRRLGQAVRAGTRAKIGGVNDDTTYIGIKDLDIPDNAMEATSIGKVQGEVEFFNPGTQGMWGAFTASSASRTHSRPRTF